MAMEVLTEKVRKALPETIMFADDSIHCGGNEADVTGYLESWRKALEDRGMRISIPKAVIKFKYLAAVVGENGGMGDGDEA